MDLTGLSSIKIAEQLVGNSKNSIDAAIAVDVEIAIYSRCMFSGSCKPPRDDVLARCQRCPVDKLRSHSACSAPAH